MKSRWLVDWCGILKVRQWLACAWQKDQSSHSDIYFNDKESVQQTSYILQILWKDLTSLSSFYCKLMWIKASDWSSNNEWELMWIKASDWSSNNEWEEKIYAIYCTLMSILQRVLLAWKNYHHNVQYFSITKLPELQDHSCSWTCPTCSSVGFTTLVYNCCVI